MLTDISKTKKLGKMLCQVYENIEKYKNWKKLKDIVMISKK